jgi:3-methyladenine DNA glycosylase AlkC
VLYYKLRMEQKILLKDVLFNQEQVERIAHEISLVYPVFDVDGFVREVVEQFAILELKARCRWIAVCLRTYLPPEYLRAVAVLVTALPPPNDPTRVDGDFGSYIYATYSTFVAEYGCTSEYLTTSLDALYEMTKRFSAEDAIRYFLNAYTEETMDRLFVWVHDSHYHVRRLCSEGTRPRLPWSQSITLSYRRAVPLLDILFCDHTRFVTRSVANHLNDISKIDSALVIETLVRWRASGKQTESEMQYIVRHSLRTRIKAGDSQALALVGYDTDTHTRILSWTYTQSVSLGAPLALSVELVSDRVETVLVEYVLYFRTKNGGLGRAKVYKWKSVSLVPNVPVTLSKHHLLRVNMTTRPLYRGLQGISIQINGKRLPVAEWEIV